MVVNKAKERMLLDVAALYKRGDENCSLFSFGRGNYFEIRKHFINRKTLEKNKSIKLNHST